MMKQGTPFVLIVLDGWGYSESADGNAIAHARTPNWDRLWAEFPHTLIQGSGLHVGLPAAQMGNSEVGHLNLGAGRVVYQDYTRIDQAIENGELADNRVLSDAIDRARADDKSLHLLGLLSPGGVHSHEHQIEAMIELAASKGMRNVVLHAFLDGRDTPPKSAADSIARAEALFRRLDCGRIASVIGRYYAMDRDQRWDRVRSAYDLIVDGVAEFKADSAAEALAMAYARGETDEFVKATSVHPEGTAPVVVNDGDIVVFMNFRADRARQLTQAFIDPGFDGFKRCRRPALAEFVSLTQYNKDFAIPVAFPPAEIRNVFGEYISRLGYRQLRVAETEKYAHVTFFFNGGEEKRFPGEQRVLVPSPKVATYDLQPEMSAGIVTDHLVEAITGGQFEVIICNFANPDMVGHTGNFEAAVQAVETIDQCLGRVLAALKQVGGEMIITADHGNVEQMVDRQSGQAHTAHTSNPVPLVYVGRSATLEAGGALSDIAPTILMLLGLEIPPEMEGRVLVRLQGAVSQGH